MNDRVLAPHRRYNPLDDSWILVSPHRTQRPWQGEELDGADDRPSYSDSCYLCPGNQRVGADRNPEYDGVFVFDNDFPALMKDALISESQNTPLFRSHPETGRCRVICYSPQHNLSLGYLTDPELLEVIRTWTTEFVQLRDEFPWVQIFENRGAAMGASNPHPHGQIWAVNHIPTIASREVTSQEAYYAANGKRLLLDYAEQELEQGQRVVLQNDSWLVVVPYWAAWPFETMLLPRAAISDLSQLDTDQQLDLAHILQKLQRGYDRLFNCEFPYSFGWHNAPSSKSADAWQLHAHFYPPLLRSASVKKFMVGYEMMAEPQRDLTPELAAQGLLDAIANESG